MKVHEKIKYFTWMCINGGIMLNWERKRRDISADVVCMCCNIDEETTEHLFRDCSKVSDTWNGLINFNCDTCLSFQVPFSTWMRSNLMKEHK